MLAGEELRTLEDEADAASGRGVRAPRLYPQVALRARLRCEYCRAPESVFNLEFEVEHIVPTARGGSDELSNLALA